MKNFHKSWTFGDRITELRAVQHPSFVRVLGFVSCFNDSDDDDDDTNNDGGNWKIPGLLLEWCEQGSLSMLLRETNGNGDTEAQTDEDVIGG